MICWLHVGCWVMAIWIRKMTSSTGCWAFPAIVRCKIRRIRWSNHIPSRDLHRKWWVPPKIAMSQDTRCAISQDDVESANLALEDASSMGASPEEPGRMTVMWHFGIDIWGVSIDGTTKSSVLTGFSTINHPLLGIPIYGNPHLCNYYVWRVTQE